MQCLFLSLCHPCARMHIIMHACTHIFKHFSIAVSTLLSFKRLRANHWEEKQEGNVASCTFLWLARQVQAEQRRQGPAIWQKHNCMHTPLKRPTNGMSTNRANKTTGAAVNQTFLKRLAACLQLWTANLSELAGSVCMYVHACPGTALPQQQFFCAPHGDSAVRGGWVSHAVYTHTRHKAQLRWVLQHRRYSERKHALHTHTILVLSVVPGVRWPFL